MVQVPLDANVWRDALRDLGLDVRLKLREIGSTASDELAEPVAIEGGDTIYWIDRCVEPVIEQVVQGWPEEWKPLMLVVEGMGPDGICRFGPEDQSAKYRVIVDPIDGTRGLMYDKRSAWFLAAVALDRGEQTALSDCFAAAMVELPTSKQAWFDSFVAVRHQGVLGQRHHVADGRHQAIKVRPSQATTLKDGFAQVSNFFPGTKELASQLMERIIAATVGSVQPGTGDVFDDQYISSGGQMVELMLGHDRFCGDLRPLFHQIIQRRTGSCIRGLECHPYDMAGALVASEAGLILTDGFGRPLDCPLNVHHGVHWCGYANTDIRDLVQPVVQEWLAEQGIQPA
jgi:hypothetical protein